MNGVLYEVAGHIIEIYLKCDYKDVLTRFCSWKKNNHTLSWCYLTLVTKNSFFSLTKIVTQPESGRCDKGYIKNSF